MNAFLDWFTSWLVGSPGRWIIDFINEYSLFFLLGVGIYGSIMLYARYVYKDYLPKQLAKIIEAELAKEQPRIEKLVEHWESKRRQMPWYIFVPSRNEFWVRKPTGQYRIEKKLLYRKENKTHVSDEELIERQLLTQSQR